MGGSTIIGPWSAGWFSKNSKPQKKSKPPSRTPEQIANIKALKREAKRKQQEAHEERQRISREKRARKKAEREADPNYIAMMEERARKKREKQERARKKAEREADPNYIAARERKTVKMLKQASEKRLASIEVIRKPLPRKSRKSK